MLTNFRRAVVFFVMLLVGAQLALSSAFAATEDAKQYADSIGNRVLEVLNDASIADKNKIMQLEELFTDVVDVDWVGRFVLGRHWRSATEAQKKEYLDAYRVFLIKHYTSRFTQYAGQTYSLPMAREERENEYLVRMEINQPQGQAPVIVDYRLRDQKGKFQVFDIIVEGVSLITTQRSEFDSMASRKGLDALITALENKTKSLQTQMERELAS